MSPHFIVSERKKDGKIVPIFKSTSAFKTLFGDEVLHINKDDMIILYDIAYIVVLKSWYYNYDEESKLEKKEIRIILEKV